MQNITLKRGERVGRGCRLTSLISAFVISIFIIPVFVFLEHLQPEHFIPLDQNQL